MGSAQDVTYVVQCVTLLCKGIIFYTVFSGLELCIKHSSLLLGQCLCLVGCGWAVELCQVFKCYSRNSYFVELVEKHNQEGQDVWLHYEKLLECKLLTWASVWFIDASPFFSSLSLCDCTMHESWAQTKFLISVTFTQHCYCSVMNEELIAHPIKIHEDNEDRNSCRHKKTKIAWRILIQARLWEVLCKKRENFRVVDTHVVLQWEGCKSAIRRIWSFLEC